MHCWARQPSDNVGIGWGHGGFGGAEWRRVATGDSSLRGTQSRPVLPRSPNVPSQPTNGHVVFSLVC